IGEKLSAVPAVSLSVRPEPSGQPTPMAPPPMEVVQLSVPPHSVSEPSDYADEERPTVVPDVEMPAIVSRDREVFAPVQTEAVTKQVSSPPASIQDKQVSSPPASIQDKQVSSPPASIQDKQVSSPPASIQDKQVSSPPASIEEGPATKQSAPPSRT